MKKITLILLLSFCFTFVQAQTIEFLSYPATFAGDGAGAYGPAVGQPDIVIKYTGITISNANLSSAGLFSPIRQTSNVQSSLSGQTITGPNVTSITGNPGTPNAGIPTLAPQGLTPASAASTESYILAGPTISDNGDGTSTVDVTIAYNRWDGTYTNGVDYTIVCRWFSTAMGDADGLEAVPVVDNGSGTLVVQGMTYDAMATIGPSLSTVDFNKSKLDAFYSSNKDALVLSTAIYGDYKIFNLLGQSVQEAKIESREISITNLKSGMYILATDHGILKFAK
ncbi:hypothetical protein FUA26_10695 [Seonamhaeicola algicola]|uniref:T9SS type A sorting domain-containing protein n=1 Tax=Seonamhaeicola algicola TaxID=1719036 RepID=A0A5C7APP9_9FLAO|nr:hypothetical protein [Seonamhaeicola algicola]TXE09944.1 hypothetical protein FUA26_10695 [Seonamhaeicola algicola]